MNYTEEDLRKIAEIIDEKYRPYTKENTLALEIMEDVIKFGLEKPIIKEDEEKIPFSYAFLRRKLDWMEFCELTGTNEWAKREGYEFKDNELFYITESKAMEFNLI